MNKLKDVLTRGFSINKEVYYILQYFCKERGIKQFEIVSEAVYKYILDLTNEDYIRNILTLKKEEKND